MPGSHAGEVPLLTNNVVTAIDAGGDDLIAKIGDWVLDTALGQMVTWRTQGLDLAISVNIAAHHLQQKNFLPRLREKLEAHPEIPPDRLELEVLETTALEGIVQILSQSADIRADKTNRGIDLMSHPCGKVTNRSQFFGLDQLFLDS